MPADGELTGRLGEEIHKKLSGEGYTILYDHGPSGAPGVGAIAAFCGEELHRETKLADLDIAVLDPNGRAILLIEIEETADRPKTILGDAMAVCLSDKIQFHGGELKVGEWTTLLIFSKRGPGNHEDRRRILEARINQLLGKRNYPGMHLKEIKLELFDDAEGARRVILSLLRTAT